MRALTIAYLADTNTVKPKYLTQQQKLYQEAVASLAARRLHDREKAKLKFCPERAELERLKEELKNLS